MSDGAAPQKSTVPQRCTFVGVASTTHCGVDAIGGYDDVGTMLHGRVVTSAVVGDGGTVVIAHHVDEVVPGDHPLGAQSLQGSVVQNHLQCAAVDR